MRKSALLLIVFACMSLQAQDMLTIEEMVPKWQTRTIKVSDGGEKPDVVQLLRAFNKVWPVYVNQGVINLSKDPKFTYFKDEEYDNEIIVDRKNGYVCDDAGGTDSGSMSACVWRRTNGHRLFAVVMSQPVDPEIVLVCFYDYNPTTQIMTPEKNMLSEFRPLKDHEKFHLYLLPRKGTDIEITEYTGDCEDLFHHVFKWDGMNFHFSHLTIGNLEIGKRWFSPKEMQYMGDLQYISYTDVDGDGDGELMLADGTDDDAGFLVLAWRAGNLEIAGLHDPVSDHEVTFYKGVVKTEAKSNDYTSYAVMNEGIVEQMITVYPTLGIGGRPKVTIDDANEQQGRTVMTAEQAEQLIRSLDSPVGFQPQWRRLVFNKDKQ